MRTKIFSNYTLDLKPQACVCLQSGSCISKEKNIYRKQKGQAEELKEKTEEECSSCLSPPQGL